MGKGRFAAMGMSIFVLMGGCGARKPAAAVTSRSTAPVQRPVLEEPKWEAAGSPLPLPTGPDALADKTAAYVKRLQKSDAVPATQGDPAPIQLTNLPSRKRGELVVAPLDAEPLPSQTAPAVLAGAVVRPEGPKIMPESADFATVQPAKDSLGSRLRKRIRENPRDISDQLDLQLYAMLNDDPSAELAAATELSVDDRELVSSIIDGLSNFRSLVRQDLNMLQPKKIQPLLEMADRLRSQALLTVNNVSLCRRVDGFGKYEPITPTRFIAGKENAAIVYCEVQNFVPLQDGRQLWKTKLTEQVTLFTDSGMIAWSDDKREVTDECRNIRHDFFAYNIIKLPSTLPIGHYTLKVSVEDINADRFAEKSVPLAIVAK